METKLYNFKLSTDLMGFVDKKIEKNPILLKNKTHVINMLLMDFHNNFPLYEMIFKRRGAPLPEEVEK